LYENATNSRYANRLFQIHAYNLKRYRLE